MKKSEKMIESPIFTGAWPVEPCYEITDEKMDGKPVQLIHPCRSGTGEGLPRLIDPSASPTLALKFSEVESRTDLLAFSRKFGLLGYNRLVSANKRCGGDPVKWSLWHARRVAATFGIFQLIKSGPQAVQKGLPTVLRSIQFDFMTGTNVEDFEKRIVRPDFLWDAEWPADPLRVAWRVLSQLINQQIRGLRVEVSEEKLRPVFVFNALLQVIYWNLAGELDELNLRLCNVCGVVFRAKRRDARHCSARCRMRDSRSKPKTRRGK